MRYQLSTRYVDLNVAVREAGDTFTGLSGDDADPGDTVLHWATMNVDVNTFRALAQRYPQFVKQKNNAGRTPLHYVASQAIDLSDTSEIENVKQVMTILKEHGALMNEQDNRSNTPLHCALAFAYNGCINPEIVAHLISLGAYLNFPGQGALPPLHFAIYWSANMPNALAAIEKLLAAGADPNVAFRFHEQQVNALSLAMKIRGDATRAGCVELLGRYGATLPAAAELTGEMRDVAGLHRELADRLAETTEALSILRTTQQPQASPLTPALQAQRARPVITPAQIIDTGPSDEIDKELAKRGLTFDMLPSAPGFDERLHVYSITSEIYKDPVLAADDSLHDRACITEWFKHNDTNPFTGAHLPNKQLRPARYVRDSILVLIEQCAKQQEKSAATVTASTAKRSRAHSW